MGNSLREVKIRISATKSISQITNAMYMVSQSKVKKSEKTYLSYQDFMKRISNVVTYVVSKAGDVKHPILASREVKKTAYLLVTSDRGLAGAYNSNVCKEFERLITDRNQTNKDFVVGAIGKMGYAYLKKMKYPLLIDSAICIKDDVLFVDMVDFARQFIKAYISAEIDELVIVYNHYINTLSQKTTSEVLLPIAKLEGDSTNVEYLFETGIEKTMDILLPMYIEDIIYGIILDAKTSEHCSRMNSMRTATDNANEVIDKLQLLYNRARQEAITNELIDVIGGANAIGGK